MNNLMERKNAIKSKKGFTLIELIVVIVILGILAAIIVPRLTGFSAKAQDATCYANQRTIETAIAVVSAEGATVTTTSNASVVAILSGGAPVCPTGGVYSVSDGVVDCTLHHRP